MAVQIIHVLNDYPSADEPCEKHAWLVAVWCGYTILRPASREGEVGKHAAQIEQQKLGILADCMFHIVY